MADLTPNEDLVAPVGAAPFFTYRAGAALQGGNVVYLDAPSQTFRPATASGTVEQAELWGIVVGRQISLNQPATVIAGGDMDMGAGSGVVAGMLYLVSINSGLIMPATDLVSGNRVSIVGVGRANNIIAMHIFASDEIYP